MSTATGVRSKAKSSAVHKESTSSSTQIQSQVPASVASTSAVQASSTANNVQEADEASITMSIYQLQVSYFYNLVIPLVILIEYIIIILRPPVSMRQISNDYSSLDTLLWKVSPMPLVKL